MNSHPLLHMQNICDESMLNDFADLEVRRLWTECCDTFRRLPWPKQADEEWRRTDISGYQIAEYTVNGGDTSAVRVPSSATATVSSYSLYELFGTTQPNIGTHDSVNTMRAVLLELLHSRMQCATHKIELLPLLSMRSVQMVYVAKGATVAEPIEIVVNNTAPQESISKLLVPFLAVVVIEEGAEAQLTVRYSSPTDDEYAVVSDVLCLVHDNARCQIASISDINIDSLHIGSGMAWVGKDSVLRVGTAVVDGMLSKHRFDVYLDGEGSETYLDGCYIGYEDQHIDVRTQQIHRAPSTNSFALYRGIATDEAHIIYQGLIEVQENAAKTDAYLTNNNILLGDSARSDSIPSLNIKTDDVKCSHGSTTGTVDQLQLFYLQARGIDKDEAVRLIIEGFLGEVVDRYPQSVREPLLQRFAEQLA